MRVITAIIICMAVNVIGREIPPANCELRICENYNDHDLL